ncbi:MAG: Antilisterial bacteriocin subtilosin biosynthesis protein AlbA [Elusimicrobia bacterium ADurb.Bin231]|nr:MAG: Antilisterial bacteriocin subtilosin biosynthesis protein AlbA [Elusimicrobia bacterium ADurb.Bin231]
MKKYKKIYVEITNSCNLKCDFCPPGKRNIQFMSPESFSRIADEIKQFTDYICLHVKGEPFLHKRLCDILDISYEKGFKINITTNGTLIRELHKKIIMKPALRQINFSLHACGDTLSGIRAEEYTKHILQFVKDALEKTGIIISLRLWNVDPIKGDHLKENRKKFELIEKEFQLSYKLEEKIIPGQGLKLAERLYLNYDYEFIWPDINDTYDNISGFCRGLRDHVGILSDGTVVPCCLDSEGIINLGNIFERKFSDIISSPRAKNIYCGFLSNKAVEILCRKCRFKEKFSNKKS